ncbi:SusC/RagA family TonB-linked outer membrane protein [Chitinophaga filiformis]|uniref:TonB-linked outer membrane protein, SusC/RagA family n=1 Tax=Chitinophaga filiformis TaxID=104663 RepID=A0A1G7HLP4_CHIFI|nr:SusC/RagA family TonB-linked outer membrane protein [Chitinophaga filiformis]SDF00919.1 TonB-linked outer membrane protein, SusC/RagA family [Chitinophaga filiformis]
MRLPLFLFFFLPYLQVATYCLGKTQADQKITLSGTYTLHIIFQKIEQQTGKRIYYTNSIVNDEEKIPVNLKAASIHQALEQILGNKNLEWSVEETYISIRKSKKATLLTESDKPDSTISVNGRVINEKGEPIAGATVLVKGTRIGSTTQSDGYFTLNSVRPSSYLLISNVAFLTKELPVQGRSSIGIIELERYIGVLDETQIIAYGQSSRRKGTGNVSTIKASDIEKSPVSNPLLAMSGRIPGVFIQQSAGVPGSGVKIIIQGQNSINSGNDPFYVIDGVPYTSQLLPGLTDELGDSGPGAAGTSPGTRGNPLNFINPQDIESINVLKDADATSIYGSRAANGAIIITTKKGKPGRTSVNVNIQNGWGKVSKKVKLLNTPQYLEMRKEAFANDGITTYPDYEFDINGVWDQNRYTDWQNEFLGGTAKYLNAYSTISGGTETSQYLFGGGFQQEGTVTPLNFSDKKASLHLNLNSTSENKKFKFSFSGNYVSDNNQLGGTSVLATAAYTLAPNAPKLYNTDGSLNYEYYNGEITFLNPLYLASQIYSNKTKNLVANATIGYEIINGLELKSSFGYNQLQSNEIYAIPTNALPPSIMPYVPRTANFNTAEISNWIIEPQATYKKNIGSGELNILIGSSIQQQNKDRQNLKAEGFSSDEAIFNIKSASSIIVDDAQDAVILSNYKYGAVFGRLNYEYNSKYMLSASVRRDGSSRFGRKNRFHSFGSIAASWVFSNEKFLKPFSRILSFGKIRASYGATGNDQIGDYSYLNLYQNTTTLGTNYQGIIGLEPFSNFPNPYLQWETTRKLSTTLDLGISNDILFISLTYYRNRSSNQLSTQALLSITGGSGIRTNLPATIQNTGFEISLNTTNVKNKNITWTSSFNLTIPRNKLLGYKGIDVAVKDEFVGKPLGVIKVYHLLGVDKNTGLYTVADRNGKATSMPDASLDKTVYIDQNPKYYGGVQNSFVYKRISLDFLFQFVKQLAGNGIFGNYLPGATPSNEVTSVLDRWQKKGDDKPIQKFSTDPSLSSKWQLANQSDKAYSNASYVRLKNISISYQLPTLLISKAKLQTARIYLQSQNLLTITKYIGGDPENRSLRGIPPLKMITVGIQVGL